MKAQIVDKLSGSLNPSYLDVIDESHMHAGHMGGRAGGDTHFRIIINSSVLSNLSKVEAHREIYKILDQELKNGVHALAIQVLTV